MQGRRIDRIEEQLRIELSEIIDREIQDPRIGLTTVTAVKVSPDLRHGRVFVTVLGDDAQRKKALEALVEGLNFDKNEARIKTEMKRMGVRRRPTLKFLPRNHFLNKTLGKFTYNFRKGRSFRGFH